MSVAPSPVQFGRVCEVIVGKGDAGQGLLVKDLRVKFEITKTIGRTPNTADVQIYNLAPANEAKVKNEFDEVIVNAGYVGAQLLIFRGNIRHAYRYREGTDYVTQIDAADGDKDFRRAVVNTTLAAGSSTSALIDHVVGTFSSTKRGHVAVKERKRIRGRVLSGMARDVLDTVAAEADAHWSIQDGELQIVAVDKTLDGEAIVLRADTGLIDAPEIDDKGIKLTCLLNPRIKPNGKVWLDNNDLKGKVQQAKEQKAGARPSKRKPKKQARLDPDGIYKVYKVVHKGDTRGGGKDWVSEVHCVALDAPIPSERTAAPPADVGVV